MPAEFSSAFSGTRRTLARAGLRAADELEPERPRLLIDLQDRVIDDLTGLDRREVDAELPGLDPRHIERVVKDSQNVLRTGPDVPGDGGRSLGRRSRRGGGACWRTFRSLLADVGTLTKNTVRVPNNSATFDELANPTPLQERALQLLSLRSHVVASRCITASSSARLAVAQELRLDQ